jgi:hypothetical protein
MDAAAARDQETSADLLAVQAGQPEQARANSDGNRHLPSLNSGDWQVAQTTGELLGHLRRRARGHELSPLTGNPPWRARNSMLLDPQIAAL